MLQHLAQVYTCRTALLRARVFPFCSALVALGCGGDESTISSSEGGGGAGASAPLFAVTTQVLGTPLIGLEPGAAQSVEYSVERRSFIGISTADFASTTLLDFALDPPREGRRGQERRVGRPCACRTTSCV